MAGWFNSREQRKPGENAKIFCQAYPKRKGTDYELSLSQLNLTTLEKRRDIFSLRWAKKCLSNKKTAKMFPLTKKKQDYNLRIPHTTNEKLPNHIYAASFEQRP